MWETDVDIFYREIIENANYHVASYKKGAIAFSAAMLLLSLLGALMIIKIGLRNKDRKKYIVLVFCVAAIMSIVFVAYSVKQITCINSEIENREWVEYSGTVFFDAGKNRLQFLNDGNSIPLFSGKDKNGIMNNNYVKAIPHNSMHGSCRPFPRLFWRRNLEKPPVFLRFLSQNRHINYSAISAHELCGIALISRRDTWSVILFT